MEDPDQKTKTPFSGLTLLGIAGLLIAGLENRNYFGVERWAGNVIFAVAIILAAIALYRAERPHWKWRLLIFLVGAGLLSVSAYWGGPGAASPPPEITIETLDGIRPPTTDEEVLRLREYMVTIVNKGPRPLHKLYLIVQYPEWPVSLPPPDRDWPIGRPNGVTVVPIFDTDYPFSGTSGAPIPLRVEQRDHRGKPATEFRVTIDELDPNVPVIFYMRTQESANVPPFRDTDGTLLPLNYLICGRFSFERQSDWIPTTFRTSLHYCPATRSVTTGQTVAGITTCPCFVISGSVRLSPGTLGQDGSITWPDGSSDPTATQARP
jgi:hypothetical protein